MRPHVTEWYGYGVEDVLDGVMSKINAVGNTAATTNEEIVDMLERSSSAMAVANTSMEQTIALETAAVEVTRNAANVGTAYKTVAARLRGYDEELDAYVNDVEELSGKIADLTKTAKTPGGISLFTDSSKTTYRSIYDILKDIADIWDDITDKEQAALLETIGGKRQGQIVAATIENFSAAEKAMATMAGSAGSADAEMEIIMDSLDYKLNELSQTWVGIAQGFFDTDMLKAAVDALNALSNAVEWVVDHMGNLGAILGTVGAAIATFTGHNILGSLGTGLISVVSSVLGFSGALEGASLGVKEYDKELTESNIITGVFGTETQQATGSVIGLSGAMKGLSGSLSGVLKSLGMFAANAVVLTVISQAISWAADAYTNFKNRVSDAATVLENAISDYNNAASAVENLKDQITENIEKMDEMSGKGLANTEDYELLQNETEELREQLALLEAQQKISARNAWSSAKETYEAIGANNFATTPDLDLTTTVQYEYASNYGGGTGTWSQNQILDATIKENENNAENLSALYLGLQDKYKGLTTEINNLQKKNALASAEEAVAIQEEIDAREAERTAVQGQMTTIEQYASSLHANLENIVTAYEDTVAAGNEVTSTEIAMYDAAQSSLSVMNKAIYGIDDSLDGVANSAQNATSAFKEMGKVTISTASLSDAIQKVNSLSSAFSDFETIYENVENGTFSMSLIDDDFVETFSSFEDEYENLLKVLNESPKDIDAVSAALDDLVNAYLDSQNLTEVLNDDTVDLIATMLEEQGVINATEYCYELLEYQKLLAEYATIDLANCTEEEMAAFLDEVEAAGEAKDAIIAYYLSKIDADNIALTTSGDVQNIMSLVQACGSGVSALKAFYEAKQGYESAKSALDTISATMHEEVTRTGQISKKTMNEYDAVMLEMYNYQKQAEAITDDALAEVQSVIDKTSLANTVGTGGGATYRPSSGGGSGSSGSGSGSGSGTASEPTSTIFDWIDTKIDATEKRIEELQDKISDAVGFTVKNATTDTALDEMNDLLATYQSMYDMYMAEAYSYDLPESYIDKIINGAMEIEEIIEDADVAEEQSIVNQINNFKEWYDKAQDVDDKIKDLKSDMKELNKAKLDNIINDFDNLSDLMGTYTDYRNSLISLREASGETVYEEDYESLIADQNAIYQTLATQYNKVRDQYDKLLASGDIEKYTDEWYEYEKELVSIQSAMADCKQEVLELEEAILDLRFEPLEEFADYIDYITDGISTLSSVIGDSNLVVDGMLTDRGLAQVALYEKGLTSAKQTVAEYGAAIDALNEMYEQGDMTLEQYNERLYEYQSAQNSAIESVEDYRQSILDLCKTAIEQEIDDMEELIQARKDALAAEKELANYQKQIAEAEKNIATLQAKIAALSGSQSREDQALRLQLESELAAAQEELAEMTAEHEQETIEDALDAELEAYTQEKNDELDELEWNLDAQDAAIEKYLKEVTDNYEIVYDTLTEYGEYYGMTMIDVLTEPWDSATAATNTFVDAVSDAVAEINYSLDQIDTSSLSNLINLLNSYSNATGMTSSSNGSSSYEDVSGMGSWYQGNGGKWWYGEPYQSNGDYWYASGGTYTINGKQYAFDEQGYMKTGWDDSEGEWRYFEPENGQLVKSSWRQSGGDWYYLDSNGWMARSAAIADKSGDGYYLVDANGVCTNYNDPIPFNQVDWDRYKQTYAKGTRNAEAGTALVNEQGYEMMRTNEGDLITLKGGEDIFTAQETARLHDLAQLPLNNIIPFDRYDAEHLGTDNSVLNINAPLFEVTGGLDVEMRDYIDERVDEIPEIIARYRKVR